MQHKVLKFTKNLHFRRKWLYLYNKRIILMADFKYAPMFQLGEDKTAYYKIPGS